MVKLRKYISKTMRRGSKQSRTASSNLRQYDICYTIVKEQPNLTLPDVHACRSLACNACSSSHKIDFIRVVATNSSSESSTP